MKNAFSAVNNIMPQMLSSEPNLYWSQNIIYVLEMCNISFLSDSDKPIIIFMLRVDNIYIYIYIYIYIWQVSNSV